MYNDSMSDMYEYDRRPPMNNKVGDIFLYRVSQGDNIYHIAREFNSSVDMILCLNGLDQNAMIFPNQQLFIPVIYKQTRSYDNNPYEMYF